MSTESETAHRNLSRVRAAIADIHQRPASVFIACGLHPTTMPVVLTALAEMERDLTQSVRSLARTTGDLELAQRREAGQQ